ncbi:helix-turn-helix domain-containing protein [Halorientalis pallida]|uniref:Helix-turn-helix domain-containing protein n=1 Tax=Halorientalis pallida TaxID=2479928 RepID=A0A498KWQ4_9EURY|nr:helix-turn-helix domain-containing protein [Halorientalis pallida]RXK46167.1 helix-turn-helix domain-containing protein [Halorientalis pallida]
MRYATEVITWEDNTFHPLDNALADEDAAHLEETYYISPLQDGTYAHLSRFRGDMAVARDILSDTDAVLDLEGPTEQDGLAYLHTDPSPLLNELITTLFEHEVVLKWPVTLLNGNPRGMRVTLIGTDESVSQALAHSPPGVSVELERIGQFDGSVSPLLVSLTERQQEVLATAVSHGYYEMPRETTQAELAAELDLSSGTVADHLRRIENKLASTVADSWV